MIYFLCGDNTDVRKQAIKDLVNDLERGNQSLVAQFDETNWSPHAILSYSESGGLFDTTYIVIIDRVLEDKEKLSFCVEHLNTFTESKNHFIFSETKSTKELLKPFEKAGAVIQKYNIETKVAKRGPNPFLLADAFGKKDKKTAWMLYVKAIEGGESPEAIAGMIFWKIKSMVSGGRTQPFEKEELLNCSRELVSIYHRARSEGSDLSIGLEQFILKSL